MTIKGLMGTKITIGSDPEFVIYDTRNHQTIPGYEFFNNKYRMVCSNVLPGGYCSNTRQCTVHNNFCAHGGFSPVIGCDGHLGELRPPASELPLEHVNTIQELFKELKPLLDNHMIIKAGTILSNTQGYSMAMGGHIHIGMPGLKGNLKGKLSKYLSYYCGIPLKKIEEPSDVQHRGWEVGGYGYFGNYDFKNYGIEWRMPASWLLSKEIAKMALCLAYTVAQDFTVAKNTTIKCDANIYRRLITTDDITPILEKIQGMEYYPIYRNEIDPLIDMIKNNETWDTGGNVLEKWDL